MVLEHLAHTDGMQKATENLLTMSRNKLLKLKDFMDGVSRGEERTGDELIEILKKEEHNADE